jgi:hypothetical protein
MVINSVLTVQLENIHAPIPFNRTRLQSVPTYSVKSSDRKRCLHGLKFIPDKPQFINFASAHINPYHYLTPVVINHDHRKHSKRKPKRDKSIKIEANPLSTQVIPNNDPIDVWPSDPNAFDMEFIRKRQIAIDNTFYRETIDTWKISSLNHLVTLIDNFISKKNLIDRVWIIYYWISQNIFYDINSTLEDIFQTGKSTCEGYSTIFLTLCDHIGIKCVQIPGYVKDVNFQINQSVFSRTNHIWNAVQLDGNHWYLIDSAWGSGYIDNNHKYKKELKTDYFLIRPEYMIYNHLPEDFQWQLLAKSISMMDYIRLPYLHSYYFIYNLTIISPRFSNMVIFDTKQSLAEVLIQAPDDVLLTCSMKDDNQSTSLTQSDINRQVWQCLVAPYDSGFHTLIIYANRLSTSNLLTNVMELGIEVPSKDFVPGKILPMTFGKFIEYKCQILSPFNGVLKRGSKVMIHCRIPNATHARISVDDIWLDEVLLKNNILKQQIIVPKREVIVYAQFVNKKLIYNYDGLIRYVVEE